MAFAIGTATDWIDAARKLRDFAAGVIDPAAHADFTAGAQVPLAERWIIQTNGGGQPALPASGTATDGEVYLKGPGGGSDNIYVQFRTYRSTNLFNWGIRGALGFVSTDLFANQLQVSSEVNLALNNASMNVWFFVSGRRIFAVFQSGTVFTSCYMGFIKQFATAAQWAYPLAVSGSVNAAATAITNLTYNHSCLPDLCLNGGQVRFADGSWYDYAAYTGSTGGRNNTRTVWPNAVANIPIPTLSFGSHNVDDSCSANQIFASFTDFTIRISSTFTGVKTLFPATLMFATVPQSLVAGEFEGVYSIYGETGMNTGDTVTIGGDTYLIFQNTWKSDFSSFFAVKRA